MTTTLRVVLEASASIGDRQAQAGRELAGALVRTAPSGCDVAALVPSVPDDVLADLQAQVPGLARVDTAPLARRELAASWQLGIAAGVGGGMIHATGLAAPLVRHDRVYHHDQTVVTMWDLAAWEAPDELARPFVSWQKAMLKRVGKHADAVVVPTHAHAERLAEIAKLGERIRVIAGAAPEGFAVPTDEVGRRRALELPGEYVLVDGTWRTGLDAAFAAVARGGAGLPIVVTGVAGSRGAEVAGLAVEAGLPAERVHVPSGLDAADRAAVLSGASVLLAPAAVTAFPWLVVDALTLGTPVIAADCAVHREIVLDGGALVDAGPDALSEELGRLLGSESARQRLSVLSGDRGRAFSWPGAAERVWQLHADL
ncbi:glycosyltransferase [Microbacterium sp. zg-Y818]|uniref:glycosyltransferase n=1 Tax=unclassified Microbacterium TaxID=2609290 RepID=UPI00214C1A2D|nr:MULTISPECIES: glycosyltransferase [unclassified Microbacterium]MCR2801732.1 glycosyltransferase [Microbacterium sp. zg.Y818]WIM23001.1 glycosyltransferase [Microbacterium sp. zg-Y818]